MDSLAQLNGFSTNDFLNRTDERPTGVIFNDTARTGPDNVIVTVVSTVVTVNRPGIEIAEVINYQNANVVYTIEIWSGQTPFLTGSTLTWSSSLPAYMTRVSSTNAAGFTVYTITGISSDKDWGYVRTFLWNLPANYASRPNWHLNHTITYYNGRTSSTERVDWITGDARFMGISDIKAVVTVTCSLRVDYRPTLALSSAFSLVFFNDPLVFTVRGRSAAQQLYLAIAGNGLIIDWGNGAGKDYTYYNSTLTWYPNQSGSVDLTNGFVTTGATSSTGIALYNTYGLTNSSFTIRVWGNITRFNGVQGTNVTTDLAMLGNAPSWYITSISSWGDSKITNLDYCMANQTQAANNCLPNNVPKSVTSVKGMFKFGRTNSGGGNASTPTGDYSLSQWDVQYIVNFQDMFRGSGSYITTGTTNRLDAWWTKSATNMNGMFYQMLQTIFPHDLSSWDVRFISSYPTNFASPLPTALPVWGTTGTH